MPGPYFVIALWVLGGAAAGGLALAMGSTARPARLALLHGAVGFAGFGLLAARLADPARGGRFGVASFPKLAAVLFALTLVFGIVMAGWRARRPPPPVFVLGIHATLALGGILLLAAYAALAE